MKSSTCSSWGLAATAILAFAMQSQAHSWVEQLSVISSAGTFVGTPGYARGFIPRSAPGWSDNTINNLIPPNGRATGNAILSTDLMCKSTQKIGSQTSGFPALAASAGDMVALRYQENGHVSLPATQAGKPTNRGTIFIYGTTQPSDSDTLLGIHKVWTADGKGGDGRGVLLATRNFDDGQCYQVNGGAISQARQKQFAHKASPLTGGDLWCQSDVTLPSSISKSSYTLYWVWDWPTLAGTPGFPNGLNETYTTCMDISISGSASKSADSVKFSEGQDLNSAAIESELLTAFIVPVTATGNADTKPTPEAHTSAAAAPKDQPSPAATSAAPANQGSGGGVFTVTQNIQDTVTIYSTVAPPSNPTQAVANSASLSIQPFLTPTTLSKAVKVDVDVTTVEDLFVQSMTVTVHSSPSSVPKIRGRAWGV